MFRYDEQRPCSGGMSEQVREDEGDRGFERAEVSSQKFEKER
jgi:hypothetical protein